MFEKIMEESKENLHDTDDILVNLCRNYENFLESGAVCHTRPLRRFVLSLDDHRDLFNNIEKVNIDEVD